MERFCHRIKSTLVAVYFKRYDLEIMSTWKDILQKWHEAETSDVTWEKVLGVLESIELKRTANDFLEKTKHHREIPQTTRF